MRDSAKDMIYEATFREANGGLGYVFAAVAVIVAIALFAFGQATGGIIASLSAALLALTARSNFRRADSLYARAVAAELAEGGDAVDEMARAA